MLMSKSLTVHRLLNGSLEENAYFIHLEDGKEGVLIDPGSEAEKLDEAIQASGAVPVMVIATHGHFDHIGQVHYFQKKYQAKFIMHQADKNLLDALPDTYAMYGLGDAVEPVPDRYIQDEETITVAGFKLRIIPTPGHSPGGLCLYHADSGQLFSGDTLFRRGIGRSDFPGGSHEKLVASIKEKLFILPGETRVYPGHGDATSLTEEQQSNPYLL